MLGHFQKCNDAYRKDIIKKVTTLAGASKTCEKELGTIFTATKDVDKLVNTLNGKLGKDCDEASLLALGHLSTVAFPGGRWSQFQGIAALQKAYEQQLLNTRDFVNVLINVGNKGSCPSCVKLNRPPCDNVGCTLGSADPNKAHAVVKVSVLNLDVPLIGTSSLQICNVGANFPSMAGIDFVMGGPGKLLAPTSVPGLAAVCTRQIAAEGIIGCDASAKKINYSVCVDHMPTASNLAGATASGACTGQSVCAETKPNAEQDIVDTAEPLTELIGGACLKQDIQPGSAGDAFVNLTTQIGLHALVSFDDCRDPSTLTSQGTPQTTALTTGTASSMVLNWDSNGTTPSGDELDSDVVSGSKYDCNALKAGGSSGVTLAGAFASVNTLEVLGNILDSTTTFNLACAP